MGDLKVQCFRWIILITICSQNLTPGESKLKESATEYFSNDVTKARDLMVVVLSQPNEFHVQKAEEFRKYFNSQLYDLHKNDWPQILFTHEEFPEVVGSWTVFPLIERFIHLADQTQLFWVFICEEDTQVELHGLVRLLSSKNSSQHHFLGRVLRDKETTIIHHFAFADNPSVFAYPDFRSGFVLSISLVRHLFERLQRDKLRAEFSIDPKFEFSLFVWDEGRGTPLVNVAEFCSVDQSVDHRCITRQPNKFPKCGQPVAKDDLFVAVKTCRKFHSDRIPVVKATWGKEATWIEYFSDVEDVGIPTTDLGVINTERGHCGKTMAIITKVANSPKLSTKPWLLIADDDTIINLGRLRSLLACYNPSQLVALGERYGYAVARGGGYDYITGGGGMVFSQPLVKKLAVSCKCYADDSPDDMTLGMCLRSLEVPVTHSRFFHQARPDDYSPEFLTNQLSVSFHKHWNCNPHKVYSDLMKSAVDQPRTEL